MNSNKSKTSYSEKLSLILSESKDRKGIIIYPPGIDWNIPMLQRPNHIASNMASNDWLYFYCTTNTYDKISGFHKISRGLYLTDRYEDLINNLERFVILIPSGHPGFSIQDIVKLKKKAVIIYDYLDAINPSVQNIASMDKKLEGYLTHKYLLENSDIVLVTAKTLFNEVNQIRQDSVHLFPNAVDYGHFHVVSQAREVPSDISKIKERGRPIVGYFGALASWFDYELLRRAACSRPDLEFVLIGWNFDGSIDKSGIIDIMHPNIHYLGVKDYSILPKYAIWFDVCILPFLLNEVTHATSPIKLFEYMALGKPIVATAMNEVKNYKNVLVANNYDEFIEKINMALKLRYDKPYLDSLDLEARDNTWESRIKQLDKILNTLLEK